MNCQGRCVARARVILFAERGVIGYQRPGDFLFACVFCWDGFSHKKMNQALAVCCRSQYLPPLPPNPTMSSPVVTVKEGMDMKKQTKTKIGVGFVVKAKGGELENITR